MSINSLSRKTAGCVLGLALLTFTVRAGEMFPFVIPSLTMPPTGSILDVSWLNDCPAGKTGFVRVQDGHFVDGSGKRVRFLGVNFTFGSAFPKHEDADKLAARLASQGVNIIRFHHMDNHAAPGGIWKNGEPKLNVLDPGQLDRLDYFIAQLKAHGIYADLNLHVSRNYWEGADFPDGLTARERRLQMPVYGKGLDKINDQMIAMQRDYARTLLTHMNPYTKTAYAQEPAVAMVEINNENSLLQLQVANLPEYYRNDVLKKWNIWLKDRHGSSEKLTLAWGGSAPLGENIAPGKWSGQGNNHFSLKQENDTITVTVSTLTPESWQIQIQQSGLTLEEGKIYTLEFSARSQAPRKLPVDVRLQKADWHNCGLNDSASLTPDWKTFSYPFRATKVEPAAVRVSFILGNGPTGEFSIKGLTLRPGGNMGLKPGESLEAGTVGGDERSGNALRHADWIRFSATTERAYDAAMRGFLKRDLRVQANIMDSQASYGGLAGCYRESSSDYVDMHSYWQHPHFPHVQWDRSDWTIPNTPVIDANNSGANLADLATYRVAGKPFAVSEYDHPAPSHYSAEMFPIIASFAALQDWDAFFQFDYGGTNWNSGAIDGFFSLQQHPGKLAFLPAAALMFRRADVTPATGQLMLTLPAGQVEDMTAQGVTMADAWKQTGVNLSESIGRRLSVRFGSSSDVAMPQSSRTGEAGSAIAWDSTAKLYTVDAPAAKAVVGRCTGKTTRLTGAEFEVQANVRNFAVLTLTAVDGKPLAYSKHLLLVAAGNVENTGMGWNATQTSVGHHWGSAPTLCEGIGAKVTLASNAKNVKVLALTGTGSPAGEVPATISNGKLTFEIGAGFKTLWYEITTQ